ncbi:MAG: glycosyltransferase [Bacteroidota bacterium]|nr:glycosyltransferase [Bacteroidota bacterium]
MKLKFLHLTLIFHPEMGYDINMMCRYNKDKYEQFIIASNDVSLWNETIETIKNKDLIFEKENNVKIIRLPSFKPKKDNLTSVILGIKKQFKIINPDITFLHAIESHGYALSVGYLLKHSKVFLCDTHTLFNQLKHASLLWKLYRSLYLKPIIISKFNQMGHKVVAYYTAKENEKILTEYLGIKQSLIGDNEISTDSQVFHHEIDQSLKEKLGINDSEITLMYVGKFDQFKQPHLILEALNMLDNNINKKIHLILVGPKNETYIETYFSSESLNISNVRVTILPPVDNKELYKYYSLAYCIIIPRLNSLSSLDAQACKTPVIMMDDSTNQDRLKHGGLLYQENNIEDLTKKIITICNHPEKRKELSENGYQYVMKNFNYSKKLDKMNEEIERKMNFY